MMDGQKIFKILDFWFIDTWNNIDQLQQSGSCIRMSESWIWVERTRPQILLKRHKSISRDRLVSFQKDLRPNPSHSNTNIRHSNTRFTPLKLIYIISSIYIPKIKCFIYFFSCASSKRKTDGLNYKLWILFAHASSREKTDGLNSELVSLTV